MAPDGFSLSFSPEFSILQTSVFQHYSSFVLYPPLSHQICISLFSVPGIQYTGANFAHSTPLPIGKTHSLKLEMSSLYLSTLMYSYYISSQIISILPSQ